MTDVLLSELIGNPRNPRRRIGDLSDLSTNVERQLQPGVALTKNVAENLSTDEKLVGAAGYIGVNANRRLAASKEFGCTGMDVVVRDRIATSSESILEAAIIENTSPTADNVVVDRDGRTTQMTIGCPERMNALDVDILQALSRAIVEADADPNTRMVVQAGTARAFCTGSDLTRRAP
ncbi:enoyl-CoA hydratase-related protein [Rhodococcus sp. OK302]|uniref:enoyl-CoA hydratase-related protein n=1 Tax=Rhodococcus sp. OK302 TaxID=1882769 RepID=UPI000B93F03B|nr:enoyl-CoA hydratase-related protein [Rhodococcus sp. OK302]OYD61393.1 enoyl-CoA hydratase/isomerase-like protein [Rhodococcus sp. OK302]